MTVNDYCSLVRSKNAGPYRLAVDCFCKDDESYRHLVSNLHTQDLAAALGVACEAMERFELDELRVLKFGLPRPVVQGSLQDRDLHGAQWAHVVAALPVNTQG